MAHETSCISVATLFLKEIFKNMQTLRHINQLEVKQYSWHKVCGSFFFVINAAVCGYHIDFRLFRFSIRRSIWFRIRLRKMKRLGIADVPIASRQISLQRTVWGTLGCFIRRVKVYGHMLHSSVWLGRQIFLIGAHPFYRLLNIIL